MSEELRYLLAAGAMVKRWMESDRRDHCVRVKVPKKMRAEFCAAMAAPCDLHKVRMQLIGQGVAFFFL